MITITFTILGYIGSNNLENNLPATTVSIDMKSKKPLSLLSANDILIHHDVWFGGAVIGSKDTMEIILPKVIEANKVYEGGLYDFKIVKLTTETKYTYEQI